MFPPIRMDNLFPIKPRNEGDSVESLYQRFNSLIPHDDINPNLTNAILAHKLQPINRYANPLTTNPIISTGINAPNPEVDTRVVPNQISPLEMAKLNFKDRELSSREEKNKKDLEFKEGKQNQDNEVRTNRAAVYKFKAEHPGMKWDTSGPTIKLMDPSTGEIHDTGIQSGHLSDEDKLNLQSGNRINEIGARANETRTTNSLNNSERNTNSLGQIVERGNQDRITNRDKPPTNSSSQQRVDYANKARELAGNPKYSKYIQMDGNNFSIKGSPSDQDYDEIHKFIYGMGDVSIPSSSVIKPDDKKEDKKDDKSKDKPKTNDSKFKVSVTPAAK